MTCKPTYDEIAAAANAIYNQPSEISWQVALRFSKLALKAAAVVRKSRTTVAKSATVQEEPELLPCPWCRKKPEIKPVMHDDRAWVLECVNKCIYKVGFSMEELVNFWNTRKDKKDD